MLGDEAGGELTGGPCLINRFGQELVNCYPELTDVKNHRTAHRPSFSCVVYSKYFAQVKGVFDVLIMS